MTNRQTVRDESVHCAPGISVPLTPRVGCRPYRPLPCRHRHRASPRVCPDHRPTTLAAGGAVAAVALVRHFAQTDADRQRRITESFSKAVEQLGSDKLEVRLGGIYSLERISKESPDDYWTVMENLTAFARERSRRNEQRVERRAYFLWQEAGRPDGRADDFWTAAAWEEGLGEPATDIAAVLTVIMRRSEQSREREGANYWHLDLSGAILKRYDLDGAHLGGAILRDAQSRSMTGKFNWSTKIIPVKFTSCQ